MTQRCLADIGGPFYDPSKPFRNWSALPFYQLDLPHAPYVDQTQLAAGITRALAYLEQIHRQGYNGIVIDNLAHLINFERAPVQVYAPNSPERIRAGIYRAAFSRLFDAAALRGMEVFVTCDMQWSTPSLRHFVGRMHPANPLLAHVNRWALEELFATLPQVSGLFVRVGETGGAHDQGRCYAGHMLYTATAHLRGLLQSLLPICERQRRLLVLRTWSIGIGETGDLMWSPERYRAVFAGFSSAQLLASIKHGPTDFFRHLPPNPTLGLPGPAQIIELQNRREYELFGMVPSAVIPQHQQTLQRAAAAPRFAGVWAWNASGGWGGGRAALGTDGWSLWTELSSALTAALLSTPELDAAAFVRRWCATRLGGPFGAAVAQVYLESSELIEQGWYLGPLERGESALGGIYLPTLLWVWWMRPTASLAIWAYLAAAVANCRAVIAGGAAAQARLCAHAERLAQLQPADDPAAQALTESVYYLCSVVAVAQAIRALLLPALVAAWGNRPAEWRQHAARAADVRAVLARHRADWAGRADLPPLELDEIDMFLQRLQHAPGMLWLQARLACQFVGQLRARRVTGRRAQALGAGAAALLVASLLLRGRSGLGLVGLTGALASVALAAPLRQRAIRMALPWLNHRLYLLPSIFFETGPAFTEWTA